MRFQGALVVALATVAILPTAGQALELQGDSAITFLVVVAGADVAFTVHDAIVESDETSKVYGYFETFIALPQFAGLTLVALRGDVAPRELFVLSAIWTGLLTAHGAYVLYSPPPGYHERASRQVWLGATFIDVGAHGTPGLGVLGRF